MDHVVAALVKSVPSLKVPDAIHIMLEAHNKGQAVVIPVPWNPQNCTGTGCAASASARPSKRLDPRLPENSIPEDL